MLLDTYPDAKYEPYLCCSCMKKCGALVNDRYCIKCWKLIERAINGHK